MSENQEMVEYSKLKKQKYTFQKLFLKIKDKAYKKEISQTITWKGFIQQTNENENKTIT